MSVEFEVEGFRHARGSSARACPQAACRSPSIHEQMLHTRLTSAQQSGCKVHFIAFKDHADDPSNLSAATLPATYSS